MEGNKEHLFLLLDHDCQLLLFPAHELNHLGEVWRILRTFKIFGLLFEFLDSHNIPLDFVVNDFHGSVSNLVRREELVELCEVGVGLEDVKKVKGQVNRLFVVVSQRAGDCAKQSFMLQHELHIFMGKAQIKQRHRSFRFHFNSLVVKLFKVNLKLFNAY